MSKSNVCAFKPALSAKHASDVNFFVNFMGKASLVEYPAVNARFSALPPAVQQTVWDRLLEMLNN